MNITKKILLTTTLIASTSFGFRCETDSECLGAALRLVKQAVKLDACGKEAKGVIDAVKDEASQQDSGAVDKLEACLYHTKKLIKRQKGMQKRIENINKALKKA